MNIIHSSISMRRVRFYAYHGVAPQERTVGSEFYVTLSVEANLATAATTDRVEDTVSYADLHAALAEEMAVPANLLEHLAARMARRIFNDFARVDALCISIEKVNPPMGADLDTAEVTLRCTRG